MKGLSSRKFLQLFCLKRQPSFHLGTSNSRSALMSWTVLGIILPMFLEGDRSMWKRQQTLLITKFLSSFFQNYFYYKYVAHMNQYPPGIVSILIEFLNTWEALLPMLTNILHALQKWSLKSLAHISQK